MAGVALSSQPKRSSRTLSRRTGGNRSSGSFVFRELHPRLVPAEIRLETADQMQGGPLRLHLPKLGASPRIVLSSAPPGPGCAVSSRRCSLLSIPTSILPLLLWVVRGISAATPRGLARPRATSAPCPVRAPL